MIVNVRLEGLEKGIKIINKTETYRLRSVNDAFRVEGFRLKNLLQAQIKAGAPGGKKFAPLTRIGRRWWGRRKNNPLTRLNLGIRYYVPNTPTPTLQVGFVGPLAARELAETTYSGLKLSKKGGYRGITKGKMSSKSWRRLGKKHQEGFAKVITLDQRKSLFRKAASMNKNNPERRVFILRKDTSLFRTPSRLIIDPFWASEKARVVRNIRSNYVKKMKGLKI